MASCPHCQASIESLSGFMSTADVSERINTLRIGKDAEIKALTGELATTRTKAGGYDAVVKERDDYRQQVDARTKKDARTALFAESKVDPALLESFEQVYSWSQNGVVDDQKKTFEAWFETDAQLHILLSDKFSAAAAAPSDNGAAEFAGVNRLPHTDAGAVLDAPPPKDGKITEQDLANIFESPEFQALDGEGKRKRIGELRAQTGHA